MYGQVIWYFFTFIVLSTPTECLHSKDDGSLSAHIKKHRRCCKPWIKLNSLKTIIGIKAETKQTKKKWVQVFKDMHLSQLAEKIVQCTDKLIILW